MAKLILNKEVSSNKMVYEVKNIYEHVLSNTLSCSKFYEIKEGEETPTITPPVTQELTSVELQNDAGASIPIVCTYNYINEFSTNYTEDPSTFSYTITLTRV